MPELKFTYEHYSTLTILSVTHIQQHSARAIGITNIISYIFLFKHILSKINIYTQLPYLN